MDDPTEQLAPGTMLGGAYRVGDLIGRGGFGTVYRATQVGLERPVAVKVLHGGVLDSGLLARFEREARAAGALDHPHIVQVTDFQLGPPPFLVMELLSGRSLAEALATGRRFEPARAVKIALQVLSALAAAHRAGLVHRDIKPANLFLVDNATGEDFVKLLDFGIAKDLGLTQGATASGAVLGTVGYMAPEQALGLSVDHRADIYALGCVLYRMLTGVPAIPITSVTELLRMLAHGSVVPLEKHDPSLPPSLCAAVMRALAHDPEARFRDADEMASALGATKPAVSRAPTTEEVAPTQTSSLAHAAAPARRTGISRGAIAAILLAGVAGGSGLALWARRANKITNPSPPEVETRIEAPPPSIIAPEPAPSASTRSDPPRNTPTPTKPTSPPKPTAAASAPAPSASSAGGKCRCNSTSGHKARICTATKKDPPCTCIGSSGPMCSKVQVFGEQSACLGGGTGQPGAACTGTVMVNGFPTGPTTNGTWSCSTCADNGFVFTGTTGEACHGFNDESGKPDNGTLACR